jgi:hypothetical protein
MRQKAWTNSGSISERILILCEGSKTEPNYFDSVKKFTRNPALEIFNSKKNSPKELVDEALFLKREAIRERNPFKEVWVVFDRDGYTKHPEVFNRANATDIKIAFSSTCFEFWLLLHFEYTTSPFSDCDSVIKRLKKHIPTYEKSSKAYYDELMNIKVKVAIRNGEQIIAHCAQTGTGKIWEFNPYTDVGKLVEKLMSL